MRYRTSIFLFLVRRAQKKRTNHCQMRKSYEFKLNFTSPTTKYRKLDAKKEPLGRRGEELLLKGVNRDFFFFFAWTFISFTLLIENGCNTRLSFMDQKD